MYTCFRKQLDELKVKCPECEEEHHPTFHIDNLTEDTVDITIITICAKCIAKNAFMSFIGHNRYREII